MPNVQSQHNGDGLRQSPGRLRADFGRPPPLVSFVLMLKIGHTLLVRRKTCTSLRAEKSVLLRHKGLAVLRARTCNFLIYVWNSQQILSTLSNSSGKHSRFFELWKDTTSIFGNSLPLFSGVQGLLVSVHPLQWNSSGRLTV